jgi:hypothetical protein
LVTLKLGTPSLQFLDTSASVDVSMDMGGTIAKKDGSDPKALPSGLLLVLTARLVNVVGTVEKGSDGNAFKPAASPDSKPPAWISVLDPNVTVAQSIAISFHHIAAAKITNSWKGSNSTGELAMYSDLTLSAMKQHFLDSAGLKYYLACISNQFVQNYKESQVLKPTKFCFSVVPGDETAKIPGTLCMWVCVKGGAGNDLDPSKQTSVTFHPAESDLSPIPLGSSASVIFR